jgi:chemotaxis protein CheC
VKTTPEQIDAFKELINIGVGRAAGSLNQMCGAHVRLRVPEVRVLEAGGLEALLRAEGGSMDGRIAAVRMPFSGSYRGSADLIVPAESAAQLVSLLIGDADSTELDALRAATLTEVGNIVLNGVLGSITNVLGDHFDYEVPSYLESTAAQLLASMVVQDAAALFLAETQFFIGESEFRIGEQEVTGRINLLFGVDSFLALKRRVGAVSVSGKPEHHCGRTQSVRCPLSFLAARRHGAGQRPLGQGVEPLHRALERRGARAGRGPSARRPFPRI